jgi:hypothetical protein
MSESTMAPELADLLEVLCLEELTPAQAARLEELMLADRDQCEHAVRFLMMHAIAERREAQCAVFPFAADSAATDSQATPEFASTAKPIVSLDRPRRPLAFRYPGYTAALVALTTCAIVLWYGFFLNRFGWRSPLEATRPAVARVVNINHVAWSPETASRFIGGELFAGDQLAINSGTVEVRLEQGTTIVVEGPANWIIDDVNQATLNEGTLRASVPAEAVGFTLDTRAARIVDLGTEFEARVSADGNADIQVIRGAVEARPRQGDTSFSRVRITAGRAVRIARGRVGPVEPNAITAPEASKPTSLELVGFYRLDGNLRDASGNGHDGPQDASVNYVAGREGRAASFVGAARTPIALPVDIGVNAMPEVTIGAWIRPHQLSRLVVLSADSRSYGRQIGIDERDGFRRGNQYRVAILAGERSGVLPLRELNIPLNRWFFVAATYKRDQREATLYVEQLGAGRLRTAANSDVEIERSNPKLLIGGNVDFPAHTWIGEIDNVFVVRGALDAQQLEEIRVRGSEAIVQYAKRR